VEAGQHLFRDGQTVRLRADPKETGAIIGVKQQIDGKYVYRVFHSADKCREYYEDQLISSDVDSPVETPVHAMASGRRVSVVAFRNGLTAHRLIHPSTDALYALKAARIEFVPFQFKPLVRLMRSDDPRLLIADEVGVGKTIEAGLVLRELESKGDVERVAVVCPKSLVSKWHSEMRRFDEDFVRVSGDQLTYLLREVSRGFWPPQFNRAIFPLELLRLDGNMFGLEGVAGKPGLMTLDPPPVLDLLIVDEAHHVCNAATSGYRVVAFLAQHARAVLFLTATPLQLHSRDLFHLVNLLRPDLFPDEETFNSAVEPNRFINRAVHLIRNRVHHRDWQTEAKTALEKVLETRWGFDYVSSDPRFRKALATLTGEAVVDVVAVELVQTLEELGSLSRVMNRTRRRDVGRFTTRDPHTIRIQMSAQEFELLNRFKEEQRRILLKQYNPTVVGLILTTLERQMTSCLPAFAARIARLSREKAFSPESVTDFIEDEQDIGTVELPSEIRSMVDALGRLTCDLPDEDAKYNRLRDVVDSALEPGRPGKVLVFSFFLDTLDYLKLRIGETQNRVGVVNGRIMDEDREELRRRFRLPRESPEAIDILLSSDVGSEGLDYEFCNTLVNYDLPWNPMRIEQRIGRIDRFGQKSPKVAIFNFVTEGTVEDRIFLRCFERLGVFTDVVGDLEAVIGEVVDELKRTALDPNLTPEKAEEHALFVADGALRRLQEERRIGEELDEQLGADDGLLEIVRTASEPGKGISATDLRLIVDNYLASSVSVHLVSDPQRPGLESLRCSEQVKVNLRNALKEGRGISAEHRDRFLAELSGNDGTLRITFDAQVASDMRDVEFCTPIHPLAKLAAHYVIDAGRALAGSYTTTDNMQRGRYVFAVCSWERKALRSGMSLHAFAWDIDRDEPAPVLANRLFELLNISRQSSETLSGATVVNLFDKLDTHIGEVMEREREELQSENELLIASSLAAAGDSFGRRIRRIEEQLGDVQDIRLKRMKVAEAENLRTKLNERIRALSSKRSVDIVVTKVAVGTLICGEPLP
jgi:ATP-dependent helicase HepA